jgi:hypothetical protein
MAANFLMFDYNRMARNTIANKFNFLKCILIGDCRTGY